MTSLRGFWKLLTKPFRKLETQTHDAEYLHQASQSHPNSKEYCTQNEDLIRHKTDKAYIQVGVDFGTSTTKIMYSQIERRLSRVLSFNHGLQTYPDFCLPSVAVINEQGRLLLGIEAAGFLEDKKWDTGFQRLKVVIAGNHDPRFRDPVSHDKFYRYCREHGLCETITPERLTAVFLAYAIHRARKAIIERPEYRDIELNLVFNICMPIDHVECKTLNEVFENIFAWAERIDREWQLADDRFDPLAASYQVENNTIDDRRVYAVPESVAAMAAYLVSLRRQEGIHAFIDFGAGTTDVSICNLALPTDGAISYWYAARNIPQGTIRIERRLAEQIESDSSCSLCTPENIRTCLAILTRELVGQNWTGA